MKQQASAWAILLIVFFFCVAFFGWMAHDAFHVAWPGALLVGVAFFVVFLALVWPPSIKEQMLKSMPEDLQQVEASPDDFVLLDHEKLQKITRELQSLGFVSLCDYSVKSETVPTVPVFARVMLHEEQHCFAEISQYFPFGKAWPLSVIILSGFGVLPVANMVATVPPLPEPGGRQARRESIANFWQCSTHNFPRRTLTRVWRYPHFIGRRLADAAPTELFRQHLADREKIAVRLAAAPFCAPLAFDLSLEQFQAWCRWTCGIYRQQLQRTNFYFALPRAFFDKREEWWGKLGRIEL